LYDGLNGLQSWFNSAIWGGEIFEIR
jgi:hypothetical protein